MKITSPWPEAGRHFIMLALAWGSFSVLFGLIQAFNVMELSKENIATQAIIGALQTAGLMMLGGFMIFSIPILVYLIVRQRNQPSAN